MGTIGIVDTASKVDTAVTVNIRNRYSRTVDTAGTVVTVGKGIQ